MFFLKKKPFTPHWAENEPLKDSYRSIFKWGDPKAFKHPSERLYAMLKDVFDLTDDDFRKKTDEGHNIVKCEAPIGLSQEQIHALTQIVGPENISTKAYDRVKYSNGKTTEEAMRLRAGDNGRVADLVVHPRSKEDVQKIVYYCHGEEIPIYPFGGGSSVNFGVRCDKGGVSLVLTTHINKVISVNPMNQTATVEAGIMGPQYERILNRAKIHYHTPHNYTCGHFPQSFEFSTVGGWISSLGSGQQSTYYGDACDIVISQEYVTPTGSFKTLDYPGTATGPKVNDIMKGSEGTFGILVSATLKIFRHMPDHRKRFGFMFPTWEDAVTASREISQGEFGLPGVFRISDPEETETGLRLYGIQGTLAEKFITQRGYEPGSRCLCIGTTEGAKAYSTTVLKNIKKIAKQYGAMNLTGYAAQKWEHSRYKDPYLREDLNDYGIIIDTLESGVTWDNLHNLHEGVRRYIKHRPGTICMTHASHFYPQGTNLYFIFIGKFPSLEDYCEFHKGVISAIQEHGGSLSHHHGVGKMIGPFMESHLGKEQMDVLKALKRHFDPHNIMNPGGTLGLD